MARPGSGSHALAIPGHAVADEGGVRQGNVSGAGRIAMDDPTSPRCVSTTRAAAAGERANAGMPTPGFSANVGESIPFEDEKAIEDVAG
jgi:hypothetical protein